MRTVTATEASRAFAALLDDVEAGETIIVTRGGRRLAVVSPATVGNGAKVQDLLRNSPIDESFADDVRAAAEAVDLQETVWRVD